VITELAKAALYGMPSTQPPQRGHRKKKVMLAAQHLNFSERVTTPANKMASLASLGPDSHRIIIAIFCWSRWTSFQLQSLLLLSTKQSAVVEYGGTACTEKV
jgi:hypothetical protein